MLPRNKFGGSWDMLPWNMFENLLNVLAILVHFKQVLGKFCLTFLPLLLSALRESEWHKRIFRAGQRSWT